MQNTQYEVKKSLKCGICGENSSRIFADEKLYVISNGEKLGIMYDQKSRSYPLEPPKYDVILNCRWDEINVLRSDGADTYIVAASGEKRTLFRLVGSMQVLEEGENIHRNLFFINKAFIGRSNKAYFISRDGRGTDND